MKKNLFCLRNDSIETSSRRRRQKSKTYPKIGKFGLFKELTVLLVLGIVLPTADVYSDGALTYELFSSGHPKFGSALLTPLTLSFIFLFPHWWRTEKTKRRRLMTFPILIFQLWPQYRALQLMITLWKNRELKNQRKFHEKLDEFNKDVSSLGKKSFAKNLRHYFNFHVCPSLPRLFIRFNLT